MGDKWPVLLLVITDVPIYRPLPGIRCEKGTREWEGPIF